MKNRFIREFTYVSSVRGNDCKLKLYNLIELIEMLMTAYLFLTSCRFLPPLPAVSSSHRVQQHCVGQHALSRGFLVIFLSWMHSFFPADRLISTTTTSHFSHAAQRHNLIDFSQNTKRKQIITEQNDYKRFLLWRLVSRIEKNCKPTYRSAWLGSRSTTHYRREKKEVIKWEK